MKTFDIIIGIIHIGLLFYCAISKEIYYLLFMGFGIIIYHFVLFQLRNKK